MASSSWRDHAPAAAAAAAAAPAPAAGGGGGGKKRVVDESGVDFVERGIRRPSAPDGIAPPLAMILDAKALSQVMPDARPSERGYHHFFHEGDDGYEPVIMPRMIDAQLVVMAKERILRRRRAAEAPASAAASSAGPTRHVGKKRVVDETGVDYTERKLLPPPPRVGAAAAAAAASASEDEREPVLFTEEEIQAEILVIRKEEEGRTTRSEILEQEERQERRRKEIVRERELAEYKARQKNQTEEEREEEEQHARKYWAVPMRESIDKLIKKMEEKAKEAKARAEIFPGGASSRVRAPASASSALQDPRAGERAYQLLEDNLELVSRVNKFEFSAMQLKFLTVFSQACAPLVYEKSWNGGTAHAFLQKHKLGEHNPFALAMTPRRFGKTWAVVAFVLALAMTVPDLKIVVFSQNERTSRALVAKINKFVAGLKVAVPAWANRFPSRDRGKVTVIPLQIPIPAGTGANKLQGPEFRGSTIRALPCTVDGMCFPSLPFPPPHMLQRGRERKKLGFST